MGANARDVESVFAAALEKSSPAERAAFLDSACGSDEHLRARVEELLTAHEEGSGLYFDSPLFDGPAASENTPIAEGPGTVIGHYKLLELIGE